MKTSHLSLHALLFALVAWLPLAWTGCNKASAVDSELVAKYRSEFALKEEPDGALAVVEIREQLLDTSDHNHDHDAHEHGVHDHGDDDHASHGDEDHAAHGDKDADDGQEHADHEGHEEGEEHAEHAHSDHEHDGEHADHDHSADLPDDEENEATLRTETARGEHADHHLEHEQDEHAAHDHGETAHDDHGHGETHAHDVSHDHDGHGEAGHVCGPECAVCSKANCDLCAEGLEVVMVGLVGGLPNAAKETQPDFPFVKGYAIIMVADPLAVAEFDSGGHNHAPGEECAFCAAHAADSSALLATVKFTDENGKVLSVDARKLFDLKEKETVVVRGKARLDQDGMLVVDAKGLYVRR